MRHRGVTLVEMIVALVIVSFISTAVFRVLRTSRRAYDHQVDRARVTNSLRAAVAILPAELRELDPRDGDLIAIAPATLRYRALRNLYFVCRAPTASGASLTLHAEFTGHRALDPAVDSVVIFADGDPTTGLDDTWLHGNLVAVRTGASCPGKTPSRTIDVAGVSARELQAVAPGAPVRSGAVTEILLYRGGDGLWWLGMRRVPQAGGRGRVQPVLGPLAPRGLEFRYYDSQGTPTQSRERVATVRVTVTARAEESMRSLNPFASLERRRVVLDIALRNAAGA